MACFRKLSQKKQEQESPGNRTEGRSAFTAAACEVVKKRDAWLNQTRRLCGGIEEAHADQPVQRKPHAALAAFHSGKIRSLVAMSLCQSFRDRPLAAPSLDMILVPLQERARFA